MQVVEQINEVSFWEEVFPFLDLLTKNECKFMLIGNIACKYHGLRVDDCEVDILVSKNEHHENVLLQTLTQFEWGKDALTTPRSCEFASLYLSIPVNEGSVDMINETPGINFDEAYERAPYVKFGKLKLKVMDREDLIRNKSLLSDPRHLEEAIELSMLASYDV